MDSKIKISERDLAHKKARISKNIEDIRYYKSLRNITNSAIRKDKLKAQIKLAKENENSENKKWQLVKMKMKGKTSGPPTKIIQNGQLITGALNIAQVMNTEYKELVEKTKKGIPVENSDPLIHFKKCSRGHQSQIGPQTSHLPRNPRHYNKNYINHISSKEHDFYENNENCSQNINPPTPKIDQQFN